MNEDRFVERVTGTEAPVVIAEAGVNHDGDPDVAHALVDVAARAGADVVKFQTFTPDLVASAMAQTAAYQRHATTDATQHELITSLALPERAWRELVDHCREVEIGFASTAFDPASLALIAELGAPFLKVPSGEITNLPFIREVAAIGAPVIISTGMSTLGEVQAAVSAAAGARHLCLLHCVSAYPTPEVDTNLRAIETLREHFGLAVGWSDHTTGDQSAVVAVALGARVVEKHVTLDTRRPGPDHAASADPAMFEAYVASVRRTRLMLGNGVKQPQDVELDVRRVARRAWHAARDLPAGTTLCRDDMVALRPATGIPPSEDITGRTLAASLSSGSPLDWEDLA